MTFTLLTREQVIEGLLEEQGAITLEVRRLATLFMEDVAAGRDPQENIDCPIKEIAMELMRASAEIEEEA